MDQQKKPDGKKPKGSIWVALIATVAVILIISGIFNAVSRGQYTQTTFSDFMSDLESDNLSEVQLQYDRIIYMTKDEAEKPASRQKACQTGLPSGDRMELAKELHAKGVKVNEVIVEDNSTIIMILYYVGMFALLFFSFRLITKRMITRFDGHKVFPVNLESMVAEHPQVHNCCVIGVNDRHHSQGQYPMVVLELADEANSMAVCRRIYENCNTYAEERGRPVAVVSVDNIPLTGSMKNDYRALEEQYADFDYEEWQENI